MEVFVSQLSKETLTLQEAFKLREDVIVKDNENLMIVHIYVEDIVLCSMSSKMLEHFAQQRKAEFKLTW